MISIGPTFQRIGFAMKQELLQPSAVSHKSIWRLTSAPFTIFSNVSGDHEQDHASNIEGLDGLAPSTLLTLQLTGTLSFCTICIVWQLTIIIASFVSEAKRSVRNIGSSDEIFSGVEGQLSPSSCSTSPEHTSLQNTVGEVHQSISFGPTTARTTSSHSSDIDR